MKKVVVLGASPNPERHSYKAVRSLLKRSYPVVPVGIKQGIIEGLFIQTGTPDVENVHTILLYIGPGHQKAYFDYILRLHPERIIFNPGTENHELVTLCKENHIEMVFDCSLVMLSTGSF